MTPLDSNLRAINSRRAQRVRAEADELRTQARSLDAQVGVLARTWDLCVDCLRPADVCSADSPCAPCVLCDAHERDHPTADCAHFDDEDK